MNKLLYLVLILKIAIIDFKIAKLRKKIKAKRWQFEFLARDVVDLRLGEDAVSLILMRSLDEVANELRALSNQVIELGVAKIKIIQRLEQ